MSTETFQSNDQLQALLDTAEHLRKTQFPHLDAELVRELLRLHGDSTVANSERLRSAEQAVEAHLARTK
jgi:hypothetical protein